MGHLAIDITQSYSIEITFEAEIANSSSSTSQPQESSYPTALILPLTNTVLLGATFTCPLKKLLRLPQTTAGPWPSRYIALLQFGRFIILQIWHVRKVSSVQCPFQATSTTEMFARLWRRRWRWRCCWWWWWWCCCCCWWWWQGRRKRRRKRESSECGWRRGIQIGVYGWGRDVKMGDDGRKLGRDGGCWCRLCRLRLNLN